MLQYVLNHKNKLEDSKQTGGNLPLVSLTSVANLPPVSATLAKLVAKLAASVVDTGVVYTCRAP